MCYFRLCSQMGSRHQDISWQKRVAVARLILLLAGTFSRLTPNIVRADVITYALPDGEQPSLDYRIQVDGKPVPVYRAITHLRDKNIHSPISIFPDG